MEGGPLAKKASEGEPFSEGVVIANRYELVSQLGVGGMGIVWRARDRRLGRAVAVKVLSRTSVGNELARARLIREARAAAALEHQGIVRVYDVGEADDGGAFLVMELIRGRSLRKVLEEGSMKLGSRAAAIVQAARALQFAHEAGIVHRDVKPDNIMIREDGHATVVDFGVAKPISTELTVIVGTVAGTPPGANLTRPGQLVGTPAYLAPEQACGLEISAATDQFSLAVTAFEAFTGKRPWTGCGFSEIIASLLRDAPVAVSSVAPVPDALDEVLGRALAKDPADRYADIGAFADALEDAAASLELDEVPSPRSSNRGSRSPPSSMRGATISTAPEPAPARTLGSLDVAVVSSSADAGGADGSRAERPREAPTKPRARHVIAAALAVAIVGGLAWGFVRPPHAASAPAPARAGEAVAVPAVVAATTTTTATTTATPEAPTPSALPTVNASATAAPSSKAPTPEPTIVARVAPTKEQRPVVAAPAPSLNVAPVATSEPAPPTASAAANAPPAPKSSGRRVRTEL